MTVLSWLGVALATLVSLASPLGLRPVLHRLGVLDVPNKRSSHSTPTLRGGGVGPLLGLAVGGSTAALSQDASGELNLVAIICATACAVGIIGLIEDITGLPVAARAGAQLCIGATLATAIAGSWALSYWWVPVAALGFTSYVNFANFMDGVNGISSLNGLVTGLTFASLGWVETAPWLMATGLLIASSFISFLPWNLLPPGMFLGDVGSYLLGGACAAVSIIAILSGVHPISALAPLSIYLADAGSTLVWRSARREPLFQAHRSHVYQRLTNTGLSHLTVAGVTALFTCTTGFVGVALAAEYLASWQAALMITALASTYLCLPALRSRKFPTSPRMRASGQRYP